MSSMRDFLDALDKQGLDELLKEADVKALQEHIQEEGLAKFFGTTWEGIVDALDDEEFDELRSAVSARLILTKDLSAVEAKIQETFSDLEVSLWTSKSGKVKAVKEFRARTGMSLADTVGLFRSLIGE